MIGPIEVWNINPPLLPDGGYPLLHDKGVIGGLAKALLGYNGNPSALEVIAYVTYLGVAFIYLRIKQKGLGSPQAKKTKKDSITTAPTQ